MRKVSAYTAKVASAAFIAVVASAPPAHAILTFSENVNGTNFQAIDNVLNDFDPAIGRILLNPAGVTFNGVTISGGVESSQTVPNNAVTTSSISVVNNSGATATLIGAVSDTGFAGPTVFAIATGSGTYQNSLGSGVALTYYIDPANTQGANNPTDTPGTLLHSFNFAVTNPLGNQSYADNAIIPFAVTGPYSMTAAFTYTVANGGTLNSRGQSLATINAAVPEPASMALLGAGLLGMGLFRRRRKAA